MASNSVQLGCAKTSYKYTLSVDWSESNADVSGNTSLIKASASLSASNVGFDALYDSYACHLKLYWHDDNNGKDVLFATSSAFTTCGMGYGTRSVSGSITVGHKSDGSLRGYVYVWFEAPTTAGGWSPSSSTCYTNWVNCTTIARASGITSVASPSEYLGQPVTVTIDRKSSDFVHNVQYRFENSPWIVASTNAATSCTFTPSKDLAKYIPKSVTGKLEVSVGTYKGSTLIGDWQYSSITLWAAADSKPYISGLSLELVSNGAPSAFDGIYIQGKSKVKATIGTVTQSYGSPIKSYRITGPRLDVYDSSGISDVLTSSGKLTYTCTVTDYRGRSYSTTNYINVKEYYPPSVSITKAVRCNSDQTPNSDGTYLDIIMGYSCAPINDANGKPINYISSKSCICNGASETSIASGTAFVMDANCDIGKQYTLTASVTDLFGRTATVTTTISTAFCVLNVNKSKTGLAIGKYSEKDAFEVDMDSYFNKPIKSDLNVDGCLYANGYARVSGALVAKNGMTQACGRPTSINDFYKDSSLRYFLATNNCTTGKPPKDSGVLNLAWDNSNWDMQLAVEKEHLYTRAGSDGNGNWSPWKTYLPVDVMFPVGAIYITANNNNPGNFLGGTWIQFGQGRTLIGQGTGNDGERSKTFTDSSSGGKYKTHHCHNTSFGWDGNYFYAASPRGSGNNDLSATGIVTNGYALTSIQSKTVTQSRVQYTEEEYIDSIQPYITVYFWERTA